jgi:heme exporter protein C
MSGTDLRLTALAALAGASLVAVVVAAYTAPVELTQGLAQKVFYVHVVCVAPAYLGFLLAGIAGVGFLIKQGRDEDEGRPSRFPAESWDRLSHASAEVGVFFCSLLLVTGPLWARPIWGVWWDWGDLRLSTTAILWFVYVGYLFLRSFAVGDYMRRTAAIVAIAGTAVIPFVSYAVRIAGNRTIHPDTPDLSPEIALARQICVIAFLVLFAYLLYLRTVVAHAEAVAEERELLRADLVESGGENPAIAHAHLAMPLGVARQAGGKSDG